MRLHLQAILDAIPDLLFEVGFDGRIYDFHSPRTELLAMPAEQFLGKLIAEVLPTETAAICMGAIDEASRLGYSGGAVYSLELPVGKHWFEVSVSAIPLENRSDWDQRFVFLSRDVSFRIQAEEDMRIAAAAFESEQGMFITDARNTILKSNRAFTRITGYGKDEVLGMTPAMFSSGRHGPAFFARMWTSLVRKGRWQGEIWNKRKSGETYPQWMSIHCVHDAQGATSNYVASFSDISMLKTAEEQIENLAFSDALTTLPNRRHLVIKMQQALLQASTSHAHGALAVLDLDDFRSLNDSLGQGSGDHVLQQVAKRLAACLEAPDSLARIGGDSFAVLLPNMGMAAPAARQYTEHVVGRMLVALRLPHLLAGVSHHRTASIGVVMFDGACEQEIEELLKRAELATYQAKAAGKNSFRFFDPKMQSDIHARIALENDLGNAIARQQFHLVFQPQVRQGHTLMGAEALLRWIHPQRGHVPTAEFIPLAEESGLVLPIGAWVLDAACRQLAAWAGQAGLCELKISVNVSALQFQQEDFVEQVLSLLARTGARPDHLKMELTESLMVTDVDSTIEKMHALRDAGVSFSLDDFGTGFSSLSLLKRLPLDQLKIDQGFVRNIMTDSNDAAIAKMVIALGHSMGLEVIAEGVESAEQCTALTDLGCHAFQGYLFGRPLKAEAFESMALDLGPQPANLA